MTLGLPCSHGGRPDGAPRARTARPLDPESETPNHRTFQATCLRFGGLSAKLIGEAASFGTCTSSIGDMERGADGATFQPHAPFLDSNRTTNALTHYIFPPNEAPRNARPHEPDRLYLDSQAFQ